MTVAEENDALRVRIVRHFCFGQRVGPGAGHALAYGIRMNALDATAMHAAMYAAQHVEAFDDDDHTSGTFNFMGGTATFALNDNDTGKTLLVELD